MRSSHAILLKIDTYRFWQNVGSQSLISKHRNDVLPIPMRNVWDERPSATIKIHPQTTRQNIRTSWDTDTFIQILNSQAIEMSTLKGTQCVYIEGRHYVWITSETVGVGGWQFYINWNVDEYSIITRLVTLLMFFHVILVNNCVCYDQVSGTNG